jgi:PAS domain-containing protein
MTSSNKERCWRSPRVPARFTRGYLEGRIAEYELERLLHHKDGSYRSILRRASYRATIRAVPIRWRGSFDITPLRETEVLLSEVARFNGSPLDSADASIAVIDEKGSILGVNQTWHAFARHNGGAES